jgi:hypothetical protein
MDVVNIKSLHSTQSWTSFINSPSFFMTCYFPMSSSAFQVEHTQYRNSIFTTSLLIRATYQAQLISWITYLFIYLELNPSWAANCAATQELPSISWNPKVQYRVHKRPPLALYWAISIQSTPSHHLSLRFILILSTHLHFGLPSGLFPSHQYPICIPLLPHSCWRPSHLILLEISLTPHLNILKWRLLRRRNNSAGVATRLWVARPRSRDLIPGRSKRPFSLRHNVQALGSIQPPTQCVRGLFLITQFHQPPINSFFLDPNILVPRSHSLSALHS